MSRPHARWATPNGAVTRVAFRERHGITRWIAHDGWVSSNLARILTLNQDRIAKSHHEDVLNRLLTEVMVDAKDLPVVEHTAQRRVDPTRALEGERSMSGTACKATTKKYGYIERFLATKASRWRGG